MSPSSESNSLASSAGRIEVQADLPLFSIPTRAGRRRDNYTEIEYVRGEDIISCPAFLSLN